MDFLERLSMGVSVVAVTHLDQTPLLCGPQPPQSITERSAGMVSEAFSALEFS